MRRHREESAGQRGDLGLGASQYIEIATVAALLRNDIKEFASVGRALARHVSLEANPALNIRGSPHCGRIFAHSGVRDNFWDGSQDLPANPGPVRPQCGLPRVLSAGLASSDTCRAKARPTEANSLVSLRRSAATVAILFVMVFSVQRSPRFAPAGSALGVLAMTPHILPAVLRYR